MVVSQLVLSLSTLHFPPLIFQEFLSGVQHLVLLEAQDERTEFLLLFKQTSQQEKLC